ncbi:type II secretion system F family protein [Vibrio nomapromontoriensis]|uniref:type II secretion system F family protein n=1 Tax=Vibrio nomapromontoriensis TaxID=2910246 RepID=UPI003D09D992
MTISLLMSVFSIVVLVFLCGSIFIQEAKRKKLIRLTLGVNNKKSVVQWVKDEFLSQSGEKEKELESTFVEAGFYNLRYVKYYYVLKVTALVLALCLMFLFIDVTWTNFIVSVTCMVVAVIVIPDLYLKLRKKRLSMKVSRKLPYMIDMMSVCMQTGMTIEASLKYLGEELNLFDKDLSFHLKKTTDEARLWGLERALTNLVERLPVPEVRSFSLALIQNLQYGTSISPILEDLSEDMRKQHLLNLEEKIGKLSAKMSVPLILFILFPIVIIILAPPVMKLTIDLG